MSSFSSRYDRIKVLGEGAYGTAYLVSPRDAPKVKQVAKEVRISHLSEKQREAALAEAEVLKMMHHSNIIAHIETFLEGPRLYIVMEYADGGDLATKILERKGGEGERRPFEERQIMFVFVQVSLALNHIHSRKVLHRDLKPMNIFLTSAGVVKLGDFGIARMMDSTDVGAQTTIGTPFYLSPEMCNSEAYGMKSDLWSLGVVTYELAALRVPFHGTSLPAVAMKIIGADPEPLPEVYSKDLSWIIFSFLEKEAAKRPRLDAVLRMPYVQGYIERLLSHTLERGVGGWEFAVGSGAAAPGASSPPRRDQLRLPSPPVQARQEAAGAAGGGSSPSRRGLVRVPSAKDSEFSQRQDAYGYEPSAAEREFLRNRQAAAETKRRIEFGGHFASGGGGGGRSASAAPQYGATGPQYADSPTRFGASAGPGRRRTDEELLEEAERHKAEVKRRGQAEREERDQARRRELDRALQQAKEDQRIARERALAAQGLGATQAAPSGDQAALDATVVVGRGDEAGLDATVVVGCGEDAGLAATILAAPSPEPAGDVGRGRESRDGGSFGVVTFGGGDECRPSRSESLPPEGVESRTQRLPTQRWDEYEAANEQGAATLYINDGSAPEPPPQRRWEAPDSGAEGSPQQRQDRDRSPQQRSGRCEAEEEGTSDGFNMSGGGGGGFGLSIPFTDKIRPKPKLSSESRPPRRRPAGEPLDASPFGDFAPAAPSAPSAGPRRPVMGRPVSGAAPPGAPGGRGAAPGAAPPPPRGSPAPPGGGASRRHASGPPREDAGSAAEGRWDGTRGGRRPAPKAAAGSPAQWLRGGPPAVSAGGGAAGLEDCATLILPNQAPTPKGYGDISLLQDALANVLCGVEGLARPTSAGSVVREEALVETLRMVRSEGH